MDKLLSMRIFVAVVEAGSLTAAAERFDISSAMVGKHLQALEARLGTRLLVRTTRRQSLTEIGREYYERCRRILADVDAAESLAEVDDRGAARRARGDRAAHLRRGVRHARGDRVSRGVSREITSNSTCRTA